MHLLSFSNIIEYLCLLFAIFFLIKDRTTFWRISVFYILIVCLTETTAGIVSRVYHHHNVGIYNVYMLIEATYVSYGLYYFLKEYIKNIVYWILSIYCIILTINAFCIYEHGINTYNSLTVSIMSVFFVVFSLLYFYVLLKAESFIDLKFHPAFWWIGGVLIFYFGGTLANFFDDIIQMKFFKELNARTIIYTTLNAFLYGFWSYSFICRTRQRKLSL